MVWEVRCRADVYSKDCYFFPIFFLIRGSGPPTFGTEELLFIFLKAWSYQDVNWGEVRIMENVWASWSGRGEGGTDVVSECGVDPERNHIYWKEPHLTLEQGRCELWGSMHRLIFFSVTYYSSTWSLLVESEDAEPWMWKADCKLYSDFWLQSIGSPTPLHCSRVSCSSLTTGNSTKLWKGGQPRKKDRSKIIPILE